MSALDRFLLLTDYFRPRTLILRRLSRALGDNLLLTAVAREVHRADPGLRLVVETPFPELFHQNPHVVRAVDGHFATTRRHFRPKYHLGPEFAPCHILDQLFDQSPVRLTDPERRPELFFSPAELESFARMFPPVDVVVCPVGKQSHSADRKEWGFDNFAAVVRARPDLRWAQIGTAGSPLLPGVANFLDRPVRESAGLLRASRLFLGLEGGLMHLARAVDRPAVVVYGGAVTPELSTYDTQVALTRRPDCSPCFTSDVRMTPCPHARKCLIEIGVGEVVAALDRVLADGRGPDRRA